MNEEDKDSLAERVIKFQRLELPGQPVMMHMGTSYLVNDLWIKVLELQEQITTEQNRIKAWLDAQHKVVQGKPNEHNYFLWAKKELFNE